MAGSWKFQPCGSCCAEPDCEDACLGTAPSQYSVLFSHAPFAAIATYQGVGGVFVCRGLLNLDGSLCCHYKYLASCTHHFDLGIGIEDGQPTIRAKRVTYDGVDCDNPTGTTYYKHTQASAYDCANFSSFRVESTGGPTFWLELSVT